MTTVEPIDEAELIEDLENNQSRVEKTVDEYINHVDYSVDPNYVPSDFALEFVTFIKLVNGKEGEENKTPVLHYQMLDQAAGTTERIANLTFRGSAKTTLLGEYLFLYIAVYNQLPGFGHVELALYVSDSIENGVKNMRKNLEYRWQESEFLQTYIPTAKFTDVRWEFHNADGGVFIIKGFGAKALSLDTVLHTETGSLTMAKCQIGDRIFGPDGKLTTIQEKSEIFHKPMYRLNLQDNRSLKVSEDHINSVIINTNPNNTLRLEEFDLTTKELLDQPLVHTKKGNYSNRGTSSKNLVYIKNTEALDFSEKSLEIDPYTLGVVLGDGRIQKPGCFVELTTHIEDLATYTEYIPYEFGKSRFDKRNPNTWTQSIRGLGPALKDFKLGVHGNDKFIPETYFTASIDQRLALLQGLMDTDGTIGNTGRTVFCSVSEQLLDDVQRLARSLGAIVRRSKKPFCVEIWLNRPLFRLPRKLAKQRYDRKDSLVAISSIEQIDDEPSQCIAVDNTDRQFLVNDFVRTHNTGVRGSKERGKRPNLAVLDDLISDEDARSDTVIASIEDTVYKAIDYALHPNRSKIIWSGTPFNARDPLYKAVESGAWRVNVFPVCEKFPCSRAEFRGAWDDRFDYDYVNKQYQKALKGGKLETFNQELMLRIMSDEDRMIQDSDISWFKRETVLRNRHRFNFYITTDFATNESQKSDYSVISVWAYNNNGDWLWIDGICKQQLMNKNIDDLFRLSSEYRPQEVGIEVSGQQGGFISWIQDQMLQRNIYFPLASQNNQEKPGIRPASNTSKLVRFNTMVPMFKMKKIMFPIELSDGPAISEAMNELKLVSRSGMRSKHDDFLDTISMLAFLHPWKPTEIGDMTQNTKDDMWDMKDQDDSMNGRMESYIV